MAHKCFFRSIRCLHGKDTLFIHNFEKMDLLGSKYGGEGDMAPAHFRDGPKAYPILRKYGDS